MSRTRLALKLVCDLLILICGSFPLLALHLWVEPHHQGFFVDDLSLRLPFKEETVTTAMMTGVSSGVAIIIVVTTEIVRYRRKVKSEDHQIEVWLWESFGILVVFLFGLMGQQLIATIAKYFIGRLRPHFFDLCRPLYNTAEPFTAYITNYECRGTNSESLLREMRLSFPSGHASTAMYFAVFLMFYIQRQWKVAGPRLLRHGVQLMLILGAWYIGMTRVADHYHHWGDVIVGFAIGGAFAVAAFLYILRPMYEKRSYNSSDFEDAIAQQRDLESRLPRAVLVNSLSYR